MLKHTYGFDAEIIYKIKTRPQEILNDIKKLDSDVIPDIVLCNGCFDILHIGHLNMLQKASEFGRLIIALNSDKSIKQIKGNKRPILTEQERAIQLSCLSFVDNIILFDEPNVLNIIKTLKPKFFIKSDLYTYESLLPEEIELIEKYNINTIFVPNIENKSTTNIINKILTVYKEE